jgi:hypothetical protein
VNPLLLVASGVREEAGVKPGGFPRLVVKPKACAGRLHGDDVVGNVGMIFSRSKCRKTSLEGDRNDRSAANHGQAVVAAGAGADR